MQLTEVIRVRVWCPIKFLWFPFDVQNCETTFHLKNPLEIAEAQFEFESDMYNIPIMLFSSIVFELQFAAPISHLGTTRLLISGSNSNWALANSKGFFK